MAGKQLRWTMIVLLVFSMAAGMYPVAAYADELEALPAGAKMTGWEQFKSGFGSHNHAVALQAGEILIDGVLDEWETYAELRLPESDSQIAMTGWSGVGDVSASVYMAYDDDYFYWAARVTDNVHTPVSDSTMWRGDSIQFAFSPEGIYGPEYGINYMDGEVHLWQFSEGKSIAGPEQIIAAAALQGNETLYEVKMPWSTIYTGKPEDGVLPFTMLFNDNDGAGRRGWMEWTPGIGKAKSPGSHGRIHLIPAGEAWSFWVEGPQEINVRSTVEHTVYAVNWQEQNRVLRLTSNLAGVMQDLTIPGRSVAEVKVPYTAVLAGTHTLDFSLSEPAGGRELTHLVSVNAVMTPAEVEANLAAVGAKLPALEQLLLQAEAQGLSTDYERINYTVIKDFIGYGEEDIAQGRLSRAYYVAVELEKLYDEAESKLTDYLNGAAFPQSAPRYVTGRPAIDGYSFMGDTRVRSTQAVEERPIFFTGYGAFNKVKGEAAKNTWFPGGASIKQRKSFPSGTFDWREAAYEYTTGPQETSYKLMIVSENTGTIWVDDLSVTKAGSTVNLVKNPGFEDLGGYAEDKDYVVSTRKLESDIEQALTKAEQLNVAVNLLISPHYFPAWALTKWPELNVANNGFIKFSLFHPKALDIMEGYLRALIPVVNQYDSLHSITLTNESVYQSNKDQYALPLWQTYLEELYDGDIAELNRIYQSGYTAFSEVPIPANVTASPWAYDYVAFNQDYFARWHEWMAGIIHELAPDLPVHAKIMGDPRGSLSWGVDIERFSEFSQINGNDNWNYINEGPKGFMEELSFYDLQASFKQAPVFNSEHHIIADGDKMYTPEQAKHVRSVLWQSAIHGRGASTIWVWERTYDEASSREGSILHRPDAVAQVGRTNLDLNRLAWEITAFQNERPQAAILYSVPAGIFSGDYSHVMLRSYEALSYSGHKAGFISEKQVAAGGLADYKLLVVPYATRVDPVTVAGIKAFMQQGGRVLLIGSHALRLTPHGEEQSAADRAYIFDNADKIIAADWTAAQIRTFLQPILNDIAPLHVKLVQPATGELPYNVEWRSVQHEGKTLLNVVNYGAEAVTVSAIAGSKQATQLTSLIAGEAVEGPGLELEPLTPYLLSLDVLENGSEGAGEENPEPEPEPGTGPIVQSPEEQPGSSQNPETTSLLDPVSGIRLNAEPDYAYIAGYEDGSFRPDQTVSRAEFSQLLHRLVVNEDKETETETGGRLFTDVEEEAWSSAAIRYLAGKGLFSGYEDGSFRPGGTLTRAEAAFVLARFVSGGSDRSSGTIFPDVSGHWAEQAVEIMAERGYLSGYPDGSFRPDAPLSRAEAVAMLNRVLGRANPPIDGVLPESGFIDLTSEHWAYREIISAAR